VQHAGFPFRIFWLLSAALACTGAAVVMLKAPFPLWLRTACVTSYFFAYQYAIVARSYALDLVFLPTLAYFFQERLTRPRLYCVLLGLCANSNAQSFIFASVLFGEFFLAEWRARNLSVDIAQATAIFGAFAGAAVFQAWPAADQSFVADAFHVTWPSALAQIDDAFIGGTGFLNGIDLPLSLPLQWLAIALLLTPSIILFRRTGHLSLFLGLVCALLLFAIVKFASPWHSGFIYFAWIFCLWQSWPRRADIPRRERDLLILSVAILAFIQTSDGVAAGLHDLAGPYSAGPAMAAELKVYRAAHPRARIAGVGFKAFAVAPWFSTNIFANYDAGAAKPAFYKWARSNRLSAGASLSDWRALIADRYDALLLSTFILRGGTLDDYVAAASAADYCLLATADGALIWRESVLEQDDLLLFAKGADCGRPVQGPRSH
jgi:hypothetical protein